jgi:hypothetical protein
MEFKAKLLFDEITGVQAAAAAAADVTVRL